VQEETETKPLDLSATRAQEIRRKSYGEDDPQRPEEGLVIMGARSISATLCQTALAIFAGVLLAAPAAQADFGPIPGTTSVTALNSNGTIDTQAGSHPYAYAVHFELKTQEDGRTEGGELRDVVADLPPGFFGSLKALPQCSQQEFEGGVPQCSGSTQVGVLHADIVEIGEVRGPIYNIAPPPGVAAEIGFKSTGLISLQYASVRSESGYGLSVITPNLPVPLVDVSETIWGVPGAASHDAERTCKGFLGCSATDVEPKPFLTLPTSCASAPEATLNFDSNLDLGAFVSETVHAVDAGGNPAPMTNCEAVPFSPSVTAAPTASSADSSGGLNFLLGLPNQGLLDPSGITESEPVRTEVLLPQGVTVNPSAAIGLGACTPAQYAAASARSAAGEGCPESSKIGTLIAQSPLLEEPIEGSVYLAAPHDNPFDSLLALYIVAKAPQRGVLIKQAGEVTADPSTGQLAATFDGLPPLAYSSFAFALRGGPRAPLTTPATCGTYTTVAKLYPFSAPTQPVERDSSFSITSGAGGGACPAGEAGEPNAPSLQSGTATPLAAGYSPFVLKLSREDGSQRLAALNVTLPPGLTGNIAGVPECSDAQLAAAAARSGFGQGAVEQSSPSCPASSELGTVTVGAGSGTPILVGGHAYLAGPYKGAPFSLAIVTPAIAGPFDLGDVLVRSALFIDPDTAQVTVKSDPLPTILEGIPLDIRSIALSISRPEFMLNPTSCETLTLSGQAISTTGQTAPLSNRFQAGGCSALAFKPVLSASTQAKASRSEGASLTVKIAAKPGEANIRKVNLELPVKLPSRLSTLQKSCTEAQFNANPAGCPADSVIGSGVAHTPILQTPLTGPAYLVSHGGAAFPDVEFVLQADERGGNVEIVLDGGTQIKNGITHSNFETVPDAPISSFESVFPEGPHSILAAVLPASANYNLCGQTLLMPTTLTGQNGAVVKQSTQIEVTGCAPSIIVKAHHVSGKTATLVVSVPSAGKLVASGAGLTAATKAVTAAGNVTLKVSLTKKEQAFLAHHPHRKLKLRVKFRFAPKKGATLSSSVSVLIG
jgi:hypothetical protein